LTEGNMSSLSVRGGVSVDMLCPGSHGPACHMSKTSAVTAASWTSWQLPRGRTVFGKFSHL